MKSSTIYSLLALSSNVAASVEHDGEAHLEPREAQRVDRPLLPWEGEDDGSRLVQVHRHSKEELKSRVEAFKKWWMDTHPGWEPGQAWSHDKRDDNPNDLHEILKDKVKDKVKDEIDDHWASLIRNGHDLISHVKRGDDDKNSLNEMFKEIFEDKAKQGSDEHQLSRRGDKDESISVESKEQRDKLMELAKQNDAKKTEKISRRDEKDESISVESNEQREKLMELVKQTDAKKIKKGPSPSSSTAAVAERAVPTDVVSNGPELRDISEPLPDVHPFLDPTDHRGIILAPSNVWNPLDPAYKPPSQKRNERSEDSEDYLDKHIAEINFKLEAALATSTATVAKPAVPTGAVPGDQQKKIDELIKKLRDNQNPWWNHWWSPIIMTTHKRNERSENNESYFDKHVSETLSKLLDSMANGGGSHPRDFHTQSKRQQDAASCHWDPRSKHATCYGGAHDTVGGTVPTWPKELGPPPKDWTGGVERRDTGKWDPEWIKVCKDLFGYKSQYDFRTESVTHEKRDEPEKDGPKWDDPLKENFKKVVLPETLNGNKMIMDSFMKIYNAKKALEEERKAKEIKENQEKLHGHHEKRYEDPGCELDTKTREIHCLVTKELIKEILEYDSGKDEHAPKFEHVKTDKEIIEETWQMKQKEKEEDSRGG